MVKGYLSPLKIIFFKNLDIFHIKINDHPKFQNIRRIQHIRLINPLTPKRHAMKILYHFLRKLNGMRKHVS